MTLFLEAAKLNAPTPGPCFLLQTTSVLPTLFQTLPPTGPGQRACAASLPCPQAPTSAGLSSLPWPLAQGRLCWLFVFLSKVSLGGERTESTDSSPQFRCPSKRPARGLPCPTALTALPQAPPASSPSSDLGLFSPPGLRMGRRERYEPHCSPPPSLPEGRETTWRRYWELEPSGSLGVPKEEHIRFGLQKVGEVCTPA